MPVTQGDVTVTQLETASGTLVSLTHDTTLPRPRSLDFEIQGTKGIWQGDQRRIYLEGKSPHETWEADTAYLQNTSTSIGNSGEKKRCVSTRTMKAWTTSCSKH